MGRMLNRSNLLILALCLFLAKFAMLPLLHWQSSALDDIALKRIKLAKLSSFDVSRDAYELESRAFFEQLEDQSRYLYQDDGNVKFQIQKHIEDVFSEHDVNIQSFRWLAEPSGDLRSLRCVVRFNADYKSLLLALWSVASGPQVIHQFQSNYVLSMPRGLTQSGSFNLIDAKGDVGFEVFVTKRNDSLKPSSMPVAHMITEANSAELAGW